MKKIVMVYCGENGAAGKALARERNDDDTSFATASGFEFAGVAESETCIIMPDLPSFKRNEISAAYGGKVELIKANGETETAAPIENFGPPPELAGLLVDAEPMTEIPFVLSPDRRSTATMAPEKRKRGRPRKTVAPVFHNETDETIARHNIITAQGVLAAIPPIPDDEAK